MSNQRPLPEFSRFVQIKALQLGEAVLHLTAKNEECMALAKRLGLQCMSDLKIEVSLTHSSLVRTRLNVKFSANVVQSCVVTLDPVEKHIADQFSVSCQLEGLEHSEKSTNLDADGGALIDPFGEDFVKIKEEGGIDIGELAAQYLSLALNPYPRAPGYREKMDLFSPGDIFKPMSTGTRQENPFSILAVRRDGKEKNDST